VVYDFFIYFSHTALISSISLTASVISAILLLSIFFSDHFRPDSSHAVSSRRVQHFFLAIGDATGRLHIFDAAQVRREADMDAAQGRATAPGDVPSAALQNALLAGIGGGGSVGAGEGNKTSESHLHSALIFEPKVLWSFFRMACLMMLFKIQYEICSIVCLSLAEKSHHLRFNVLFFDV
jgi:hypothetical protein